MDRWDAVETSLIADLTNFTTGPAAQQAFAEFAAEKIAEVQRQDQPSTTTVYVNGNEGAPLSSVKVPGVVRAEFGYLREVVAEIWNMLVQASPYAAKRPGANPATHYKDQHLIFVNGVETKDITNLPPDAVVVFANMQPYTRKVENGFSAQAPSGVYQMVARRARARFGNSVRVEFGYDIFPGSGPNQSNNVRLSRTKSRSDDRLPTITVTSSGE